MKKIVLFLIAFCITYLLPAQLNMTLRSQVSYSESLNDVWGYSANGREYALVGLRTGVNIVDVTNPDQPVDLGTARGASSTWRDIKTWDGFAYITNETGGGLMVIDLRQLPDPIISDDYYNWEPNLTGLGFLSSCHNIFIDEFGYGYITGCNINNGAPVFLDLFTTPGTPILAGKGQPIYSHDVYARGGLMYASEIYEGRLAIYNVQNKSNPALINSQLTPNLFTHNAWLSDDGNTVFTTDERANAPVAAYDISDPQDIKEIDQFRPLMTLSEGVIPHNVHVWEDWLIVSYYTDGCIIVDASHPDNLIEVGNFDTFIPNTTGFDGVWGVYPFLPSRTVLASDIGNGLYVLTPNYVRACWLEGKVVNKVNGSALGGVKVRIDAPELNQGDTNFKGIFKTGLANAGTFEVSFEKEGFNTKTINVNFENGVLTELLVELEPILSVFGTVKDEDTQLPIPFADVVLFQNNTSAAFPTKANADGEFALGGFSVGEYDLIAGAWGYQMKGISYTINGTQNAEIELSKGYQDDFMFDFGWETTANTTKGEWERGEPVGTTNGGEQSNPELDLADDFGNQCYVTGNGGGAPGIDDVDGGSVLLHSPSMDLSDYQNPTLQFHYWFYNAISSGPATDYLIVKASNGIEEVVLQTIKKSESAWNGPISIPLSPALAITDNMRIHFEAADIEGASFVEAGIDGFSITEGNILPITASIENDWLLTALPTTFGESTTISYKIPQWVPGTQLNVYNLLGQRVERIALEADEAGITVGQQYQSGIYFLQIEQAGKTSASIRIVKNN